MESTFISIHDLTIHAHLLYASDSITDILGYTPQEVIGRSCFEYFHPDEIPFARSKYGRGVALDKAAMLSYARIKSKAGYWVGCECVFTVVYDVLVASTSIYRRGMKSEKRAYEAPIIRRLFASSPQDPRYHMLSHLSSKFTTGPESLEHEPRAAMFLNRFTRTLAIMYATNALATILGISADETKGKSFYECIEENCLPEAIRCLESAKANDSIAYLRFWFRDPRQEEVPQEQPMTDGITTSSIDSDDDDGGVHLNSHSSRGTSIEPSYHSDDGTSATNTRSSSGESTDLEAGSNAAIFGDSRIPDSSASSLPSPGAGSTHTRPSPSQTPALLPPAAPIEVEAVVSCTSDGLVVVLRRARPIVSETDPTGQPIEYRNGLFASPWAAPPIMPAPQESRGAFTGSFLPDIGGLRSNGFPGVRPPPSFLSSIRDVAAFAWSLTGINGSLAQYGRGTPTGESQPPDGFPVWDPSTGNTQPKVDSFAKTSPQYTPSHTNGLSTVPNEHDTYQTYHTQQQPIVRETHLGLTPGDYDGSNYGAPPDHMDMDYEGRPRS